jgi:hypothetical protein
MRTCRIADCGREAKARGLCNRHYMYLWRRYSADEMDETEALDCVAEKDVLSAMRAGIVISSRCDVVEAAQKELERARTAYANACSLKSRMFWRNEISAIEAQLETTTTCKT